MRISLILLALLLSGCVVGGVVQSQNDVTARAVAPFPDLVANQVVIHPDMVVGGALTTSVENVKAAGVTRIIDLRGDNEAGVAQEEAEATALGLSYIRFTMPAAADDIRAVLPDLIALIDSVAGKKTLLHCGSGNRAGAAWALYVWQKGMTAEQALEEGRKAGMTSREAVVREVMGL